MSKREYVAMRYFEVSYLALLKGDTLVDNIHFLLGDIFLEHAFLSNLLDIVTMHLKREGET